MDIQFVIKIKVNKKNKKQNKYKKRRNSVRPNIINKIEYLYLKRVKNEYTDNLNNINFTVLELHENITRYKLY